MSKTRLRHRRRAIVYTPTESKNRRAQFPKWAMNLFVHHRYKVVYGGRGGARSWSFARAILLICSKVKTRVLCTREIQASLKDSVHQLMRDQIEKMQLNGFDVTDREIRHENGSLILFAGLRNNVNKIKSMEAVDICWVEEAERVTKKSWRTLIPTIRKKGSEIWVSFNPDQEDDATWQRFIVNKPPRAWVLKVNGEDNPWFGEDLAEERAYDYKVDPESADHVWGGNIRVVSDAQILRGKFVVEEFTVPIDEETKEPLWNGPYQGMDFGFSDPFAAIRCWVFDDTLYVSDEAWAVKLDQHRITSFVNERIPLFDLLRTRGDSSRPDTISYLQKHGLPRMVPATKGANSVEDGIAHLRSYKKIVLHPRCKRTLDECKRYSYKVDEKSGDVLFGVIVDEHNHLIDCLRYALEPLMKKQRVARLMTVDDVQMVICPVCDSRLPDDGECPHCGAFVDMVTGQLIDARENEFAGVVAEEEEPIAIDFRPDGNGNGFSAKDSPSMDAVRNMITLVGSLND